MAYTGTGAQDDPYVVDDWDSLTEKIADTEAYVTVADNVDIDLTKIYPEGIPYSNAQPLLNFACKEFDGNGITIRNAYNLSRRTGSNAVIECAVTCDALSNMNFVNFYINSATELIKSRKTGSYITVAHCTFKGIWFTSITEPWEHIKRFFDCVFNIKYTTVGSTAYMYNTATFDSCWLRFDTNTKWNGSNGFQHFVNTYLEGRFTVTSNSQKIIDTGNSLVSIINATLDAGEYTGITIYSWSSSIDILVNSDKYIGTITPTVNSGANPFIEVTDSQLKDYDYLKNIFPVVPNEEGSGG